MNTAKVKAYAKLNLSLDIKGVLDGFHMLDSFVCTVDLYDLIVAKKRKDGQVFVTFKGLDTDKIPPFGNNVEKAANAFFKRFDGTGAEITVFRNIPVGAGMGASSADISGTLAALSLLYPRPFEEVKDLADSLGSDTGYLMSGGFKRISGRGEIVEPVPESSVERLHFLAICPQSGVSAGECYRAYDELRAVYPARTQEAVEAYCLGDLPRLGSALSNHLTEAAKSLNGEVATALLEAESFSPLGVTMTGSGSAVVALFDSREMVEWAKSRYKGRFRTFVLKTTEKTKKAIRNPFVLSEGE